MKTGYLASLCRCTMTLPSTTQMAKFSELKVKGETTIMFLN